MRSGEARYVENRCCGGLTVTKSGDAGPRTEITTFIGGGAATLCRSTFETSDAADVQRLLES